jgi:hypothetical protein
VRELNLNVALAAKMISEIPKTKSGKNKVNKGQLPLSHPKIARLAHHNHCN